MREADAGRSIRPVSSPTRSNSDSLSNSRGLDQMAAVLPDVPSASLMRVVICRSVALPSSGSCGPESSPVLQEARIERLRILNGAVRLLHGNMRSSDVRK